MAALLVVDASPAKIGARVGALLAPGVVYWLLRERDDRRMNRESRETQERDGA